MRKTSIQWCHSTINPVMGCDGCELWPALPAITCKLVKVARGCAVSAAAKCVPADVESTIDKISDTSQLYAQREAVADVIVKELNLPRPAREQLSDVVRQSCKCYAGLTGTMRAGHKGYADQFEKPKLFPGRMASAIRWRAPSAEEHMAKPWLMGAPRMVFVSDMGDALSQSVSFEYLHSQIIDPVSSEAGSRHLWLWLTKRPARMAEFGRYLKVEGVSWPDNLVAMTTVTSHGTRARVDQLRRVPAKFKGLSCEPLFSELNLDLSGIDWLIVGGGSDILAEPLHVEWALRLRELCLESDTAFFLKQLGRNPYLNGQRLYLADPHGGEWDQWPQSSWKVREIPKGFCRRAHPITSL